MAQYENKTYLDVVTNVKKKRRKDKFIRIGNLLGMGAVGFGVFELIENKQPLHDPTTELEESEQARGRVVKILSDSKNITSTGLDKVQLISMFYELTLLRALNHQNIIEVTKYKILENGDNKLITLPMFQCRISLDKLIYTPTYATLKYDEVRSVAGQLFSAVHHLGVCGVVHKDIKPGNIMLDTDEKTIKLIDFGCLSGFERKVQDTGGTVFYKPPEYIAGYSVFNNTFDLWSAAVTTIELLTKIPVFAYSGKDSTFSDKGDTQEFGVLRRIAYVYPRADRGIPKYNETDYYDKDEYDKASKIVNSRASAEGTLYNTLVNGTQPTKQISSTTKDPGGGATEYIKKMAGGGDKDKDFIEFVTGILKFKSSERMTSKKAIDHPYIRDYAIEGEVLPQGIEDINSILKIGEGISDEPKGGSYEVLTGMLREVDTLNLNIFKPDTKKPVESNPLE